MLDKLQAYINPNAKTARFAEVPLHVLGHGQLTVPLVRGDSQGRGESYEQRAPVFTLAGSLRQWLDIMEFIVSKPKSYS